MPAPSPAIGLLPGETASWLDISVDALWLERDTGKGIPLGYTTHGNPNGSQLDDLWTDDVLFPMAPGVRLQLTARLTDQMAVEASAWGLQQWSVGRTIYGDPVGESVVAYSSWLNTPWIIGGFDNSLSYTYKSEVVNAEINQRFKLLSFDPYRAFSWLWGVRYFHLGDDFTLSGTDIHPLDSESLNWRTNNNLVGLQAGLNWTWGGSRFQLTTEAKAGLYANIYSQHGIDSATGTAGVPTFDTSHGGTDLAAIFELSLLARYRITECLWLRGGYQCYGVTGLSLGPRQLGGYDANGSLGLDGLSLGLEFTR